MNESFQVGEIASFKHLQGPFGRLNGEDCEILELERLRDVRDFFGNPGFRKTYIVAYCGFPCAVPASKLQKKPGPSVFNAVPRELEAA